MQSLFEGQASYLDYKKRTKPMQARELIKRLEDPLKRQKSSVEGKFIKKSKSLVNNIINNSDTIFLTEARNLYGANTL